MPVMEQEHLDRILFGIFREHKTIYEFVDTIFGFLTRNTNFQSIKSSERERLQQTFFDALAATDPNQQSSDRSENTITGKSRTATSEKEIETETAVDGSKFELKYLITGTETSSEGQMVFNSDHLMSDAECSFNLQIQKSGTGIRRYRKILPKDYFDQSEKISAECSVIQRDNLENYKKRVYKCGECSDIFNSFRQLKVHEAFHISQAENGISICIYCCSLFANAETLEKHIGECHSNGRYLCVPCSRTYKSRGQLLKHVNSSAHNASALLYYCSLCPRSEKSHIEFLSRPALQQHYQEMHLLMPANQDEDDVEIEMNEEFLDEFLLNNVNENSFNFSECWDALDLNLPEMLHLTSTDEDDPNAKVNIVQNTEFPFKCPKCYEGLSSQKFLLQHCAHKHGLRVLICNKCDSSFKDYTQWIHHKRTHRVQCEVVRIGKGEPLKCEICDKIFQSNAALNYHVKTHLRSSMQAAHECPYCQKHFHSDINFKQHIRIVHSHTKRHKCELCDKPFATLDHLKKHVLSQHQNERKHICQVCAKSFTQLCHLKQHLAIHTTGKSQQCIKCTEKFWRKIDLQRHMLKKHS
ncbi:zinc finger protein 470-like isoform X1 [Rhagoletis pomonella]|uniref:zinc finger protein 470-like isoform X1 n=1 Tax=Rhagoletis pomonella TaxID=28610 RepID=UPI0017803FF4|nr:zinc finger protein 470-like isoform X1 [Rhagoletis pomonella]